MKTKVTKEPKKFEPVTLNIVIESQYELDFFGSLFNHTSVCQAANEIARLDFVNLRHELRNFGANISNVTALKLTRKND